MRSNAVCWNPMEAFNFTVANEVGVGGLLATRKPTLIPNPPPPLDRTTTSTPSTCARWTARATSTRIMCPLVSYRRILIVGEQLAAISLTPALPDSARHRLRAHWQAVCERRLRQVHPHLRRRSRTQRVRARLWDVAWLRGACWADETHPHAIAVPASEIYHTKRMQRIFAVLWSADNKFVMSASDEASIRSVATCRLFS